MQSTAARENVIHLARTPEEKSPETVSDSFSTDKTETVKNLSGVSEAWVADHAKHVTRMLPGGMFVQGLREVLHNYIYFTVLVTD